MSEQNDTRHVRVVLSVEHHKSLRLAAALSDQAMSEFARDAIMEAATGVTGTLAATVAAGTDLQRKKATKKAAGKGQCLKQCE